MNRLSVPILVGSIREGRQSLRVASLFLTELQREATLDTNLLDLKECALPLLVRKPDERDPQPAAVATFSAKIRSAAALVIVAPEYKNGIPGALKNALDLLPPQALRRRPVAICTISSGGLGGIHCLGQLRQVVLALGGLPIPDSLPISYVAQQLDPSDGERAANLREKIQALTREFMWYVKALSCEPAAGLPAMPEATSFR